MMPQSHRRQLHLILVWLRDRGDCPAESSPADHRDATPPPKVKRPAWHRGLPGLYCDRTIDNRPRHSKRSGDARAQGRRGRSVWIFASRADPWAAVYAVESLGYKTRASLGKIGEECR